MSLSVAIMGHNSRMHFIRELQEQLPEAELVLDRENNRWDTGARSLLAFDPAADFHLVVQDDAILCGDLLAGAELAARAAGERPVSLYTGRVRPHQQTVSPAVRRAIRLGKPFISYKGPLWGVGIIVPTSCIPELVKWGNAHPKVANYDRRIGVFFEQQRINCWYSVPSLVDHRPVAENPSLVKGRIGNRMAHSFIGESSPLEIDWRRGAVDVTRATFTRGEEIRKVPVRGSRYRRLVADPEWKEAA